MKQLTEGQSRMHKVIINGVEYTPALTATSSKERDYKLCDDVLGQIAKRAALNHWDRHEYMPTDPSQEWKAHGWVIEAMALAIAADRSCRELPEQPAKTTIEEAYELGAKGAEPTESERLLFEAWMKGHCWSVIGDWDGKQYIHPTERNGYVNPSAQNTRQLFAVWRDRAALDTAQQPAPSVPLESSDAASEAIDAMLKEYNYPANPKNAARAGWRACRLLAAAPQPKEPATYTPPKIIDPDAPHPCFN